MMVYHGLGEILLTMFPGRSVVRDALPVGAESAWVMAISLAMLIFAVAVCVSTRPPKHVAAPVRDSRSAEVAFTPLPLVVLSLPLILWTAQGQGALAAGTYGSKAASASLQSSLSTSFLVLLVPMAAGALVARYGVKWMWLALAYLVIGLGLSGQRIEIAVGVVVFAYVVIRSGMRIPRHRVALVAVFVLAVGLVMTSARANVGREAFGEGQGGDVRGRAVVEGVEGVFNDRTREAIVRDLGYRLDGNSYGAFVLHNYQQGVANIGFQPLVNSVLVAVPGFLDPGKLDRPVENRVEKLYVQNRLDMPVRDMLATQLGSLVAYLGIASLLLGAFFMGLLVGRFDRWLSASVHDSGLRITAGAAGVSAVMHYGRGLESWILTARSALFILAILWLYDRLKPSLNQHTVSARQRPGMGAFHGVLRP